MSEPVDYSSLWSTMDLLDDAVDAYVDFIDTLKRLKLPVPHDLYVWESLYEQLQIKLRDTIRDMDI